MTYTHDRPIDLDEKVVRDDGDCWTFTGYASIFGSKDLGGDVIMPGAFAKSLRDHGLPLLLWQHEHDDVPRGHLRRSKGRPPRSVDQRRTAQG